MRHTRQHVLSIVWVLLIGCAESPEEPVAPWSGALAHPADGSVLLCHVPPGNRGAMSELTLDPADAEAHLASHTGDHLGRCERIRIDETDGQLTLPVSISASGSGTTRIGRFAFEAGAGTIEVDHRSMDAAAYLYQPWPDFGFDLYQVLAVDRDSWFEAWLYCYGPNLYFLYSLGTDDQPLFGEWATGTCSRVYTTTEVDVHFPAVDMPYPELVGGYTVSGDLIALDGAAPGRLTVAGTDYVLLPFEEVDCSTVCGYPGWYELHSLLWDPDGEQACFAIVYLFDAYPILVTYALCLPDLSDPIGDLWLSGSWRHAP